MESTQVTRAHSATELLREDHRQLQDLFSLFESETDHHEKKRIALRALRELQIHSILEEEIFYPAARRVLEDDQLVSDSREAHHVARVLMRELKLTPAGERFNGKFRVLIDNMRNHISREEEVLLPKMERAGIDLMRLGSQMEACRYETLTRSIVRRGNMGRNVMIFGALAAVTALIVNSFSSERRC